MRFERLKEEAGRIGKPSWRAMLRYVAELHRKSVHPPKGHMPYAWENIGPGYCYGPAFGHWDIIHAIFDVLPVELEHAREQLLNNLAGQQEDGLIPGVVWMKNTPPDFSTIFGHPPVWIYAVDAYAAACGSQELLGLCFDHLTRQIRWFETKRKAEPEGFYYLDILTNDWESGVDEGIRFIDVKTGSHACVDATSHVYALYECAARWAAALGGDPAAWCAKADGLKAFIQERLYSEETGFFHDIWAAGDPSKRCLAFEGVWPVVVGAATAEQARRVIDDNLLNPDRFLAAHPITTVAMSDPRFEMRMWRGPAWNSMTFWAAKGCVRYGRTAAAVQLLEMALDDSARQFGRTGTIWEFYHSDGGDQLKVQRKPHTQNNTPCRDYLGHNPLLAMARMFDQATA